MAWASTVTLDQRSLTGTYFILEDTSVDWSTTLNPGEIAVVEFKFDYTIVTSDDDGLIDIVIQKSIDDSVFETESQAQRILYDVIDDPDIHIVTVTGCYAFQIAARLRDNDDTVWSGSDTCTLDTKVRKDGVNI